LLDGSVRVHEMDGFQWYAPGHQVVAITHGSSGMCTAGHEIVLRDLSTEKVTNTLTEPAEGLLPVQWSPDGSQLLFGSYPGEDVCSGAVTITYSLLPRSGGTPQPVGDVDALRRSWGSANAVSLQCVQDSNTSPFASWPQPRLSGMIYYGCGGSPAGQPASVKLGDQTLRTVAGNPPMILVLGAT
jgi:hypothetical protein